ncbi:DNA helicase, partial [Tanacetum coccineum]
SNGVIAFCYNLLRRCGFVGRIADRPTQSHEFLFMQLATLTSRSQPLEIEILNAVQRIFQHQSNSTGPRQDPQVSSSKNSNKQADKPANCAAMKSEPLHPLPFAHCTAMKMSECVYLFLCVLAPMSNEEDAIDSLNKGEEYMEAFPEQLTHADRADVVDRVFEQKIRDYVKYVRTAKPFGDITAVLYTIEFQKRGLPHCHSLLWRRPMDYRIVSELMMHGPCGLTNKNAACMKDETKCNLHFPKAYSNATYIDKDGFVHYRRRETGIETERQNVLLDNRIKIYCPPEACRRILEFPIQLSNSKLFKSLQFTSENMLSNKVHGSKERHLSIFPSEYAWYATDKYWQRRRNLNKPSIGRLTYIHPSAGDLFYQRMLLCHQKRMQIFLEIYDSKQKSASKLTELHVKHWDFLANPISLWENFWEHMSDDILRRLSRTLQIPDIHKNKTKMKATVLFDIESILNLYSKSLKDFGLPMPP